MEYFDWFRANLYAASSASALLVLGFAQMFIGTGILYFLCAYWISKNLQRPIFHICFLYLSVWFYIDITTAVIFGGEIRLPSYLFTIYGLPELLSILMLYLGFKLGQKPISDQNVLKIWFEMNILPGESKREGKLQIKRGGYLSIDVFLS